MPSASPFEGGLICPINKPIENVVSSWDCNEGEYFSMCEDLFTVNVVHNNNSNSSSGSSHNNNLTTAMTMTPHLGHLINTNSHQALPLPQPPQQQQQQQQQQHSVVDVSPDASVNGHHHNHLQHHHHHQQQQHHHHHQQQQQHPSDFMVCLLPIGQNGNSSTNNNNNSNSNNNNNNNNTNTNNMNNNSTTAHKTIPVFSGSFSNGSWEKKLPADWDENDTIDWLFAVAGKLGIPCEYFASFGHIRGSTLLEMNKEDFQSKYPNHGDKFFDAFRQLIHQIQNQQQQQHHSPSTIETSATDLLGLQNTPAVHHHNTNNDCWSMMAPSIEQNYLHPSVNNMVQQENNMGYCAATDRHQYPIDSSYIYLNGANHHSHHHHHIASKALGYADPLHHSGFQQQQQQQQQQQHQQQHENYDSYSLDIIGEHYENYSNGTPSDPEEIMAPSDAVTVNVTGLKRVGRPTGNKPSNRRRKQDRGYGKLWEFIRDLLHDPKYCPSMVRWEDVNDGVFRIVQSEKLANLWGTIKNNPRMTYEKLSRAMRYYYKSKVFLPVLGRRLVYKFGPHAVLWKPDNPNFEQPCLDGQT